jgi:hypothetical protein
MLRTGRKTTRIGILGFFYEALHVTIVRLKLWHGLALAAISVISLFNFDVLEDVYRFTNEKAQPVVPFINIALQVVPFVAVGLIWTLRKLLDVQVENLGERLVNVEAATSQLSRATGDLSIAATGAVTTIESASGTIIADTQTAARGLSQSALTAASDVARATEGMSREAEIARQKLEQQSERMKNEMERLAEDLGTRTEQILANMKAHVSMGAQNGTSTVQIEDSTASWERIRSIWKDARDDVAKVLSHIFDYEDGRTTRHIKLDFRNYSDVAKQLERYHFITTQSREAIEEMDGRFKQLKSVWRTATTEDVQNFERWRDRFHSENGDRLQ